MRPTPASRRPAGRATSTSSATSRPTRRIAGGCDVIVADGYSGNMMLKSVEGAAKLMSGRALKKMLTKSAKTKLAYLLLKDGLADFKKMLDPNEVGGTALPRYLPARRQGARLLQRRGHRKRGAAGHSRRGERHHRGHHAKSWP